MNKKLNKAFNAKKFSKDIARKRKKDKLGLRPAAEIIGINYSTLSNIETGKHIALDHLSPVCNWLNVPVQKYFG